MSFILPNDMENSDLSPDEKARFLNRVNIRLFRKSDLGDIRRLFEIAFPVSYPDSLFDSIAAQFYKGNKLVTYVAEYLEEVGDHMFITRRTILFLLDLLCFKVICLTDQETTFQTSLGIVFVIIFSIFKTSLFYPSINGMD